jgi:5-deoxy-D-glucuronate isomerase
VGSSWNLNASNLGRLIHYVSYSIKPLQCLSSLTAITRDGSLPSATVVRVEDLVLVADGSQPVLDADAGFVAREMFYFDISIFNGVLLWRYLSTDGSY